MEYRGLSADSFIVKPLQRLVKYPLLLREIKGSIDADAPEIQTINKLTADINSVIALTNEETKRKEQLRRIKTTHLLLENLGVYKKIVKKDQNSYHSFIYSSRVSFIDLLQKDCESESGYLILFESFLLVAGIDIENNGKIFYHAPLLNIKLLSAAPTGLKEIFLCFYLFFYSFLIIKKVLSYIV